jgi:DNA-binding CsgD family transcriptional regulator
LHVRLPACRVVILTVLGRPGQLREALDAHVSGFMVKDAPSDQLIDVLRRVAAGERVIDQKLALAALEMKESPLTERETDVLRRFAAGADLPEIAAELFLSYGTVRNYLAAAVTKLGGRNRMDAVQIAVLRKRLISTLERNGAEPSVTGDIADWLDTLASRVEHALRTRGAATGAELSTDVPLLRTASTDGSSPASGGPTGCQAWTLTKPARRSPAAT